jgi:uncharacterized protein (TIGR00730 family)
MPRICIYCGSSFGKSADYAAIASGFGSACARRGLGVVYGGGGVGLMGALADAALAAGGEVIGVIPQSMVCEERAHHGLTRLIPVGSMHERKRVMVELSDCFAALPGGIGTLDELVEVYSWLQLGFHLKPVGLLNAGGFFDALLRQLDHMTEQQFLTQAHRDMLSVERDPEALLDRLTSIKHQPIPKPVHRTRRQE